MKEKGIRPDDYSPDISPAQQKVARVLLKGVFKIFTGGITVTGQENIPENPPFFAAVPHLGWLDALAEMYALSDKHWTHWLTKAENFSNFLAPLVRFGGFFPIQRGQVDRRAIRAVEAMIKKGKVVGIAPEGTRGRGDDVGRLNKAKPGLFWLATRLQAPILPIAVSGADKLFPLIDEETPSISQLTNTLIINRPKIRVVILKPFTDHLMPQIRDLDGRVTRKTLEDLTQNLMVEFALNLPVENRGYYATIKPINLFNR